MCAAVHCALCTVQYLLRKNLHANVLYTYYTRTIIHGYIPKVVYEGMKVCIYYDIVLYVYNVVPSYFRKYLRTKVLYECTKVQVRVQLYCLSLTCELQRKLF